MKLIKAIRDSVDGRLYKAGDVFALIGNYGHTSNVLDLSNRHMLCVVSDHFEELPGEIDAGMCPFCREWYTSIDELAAKHSAC